MTLPTDLGERLDFAIHAARAAGDLTRRYFRSPGLVVEIKGDGTPVTEADRQAERLLRERIAATYPADSILGEEEGSSAGTSGCLWILDPIDGTESFRRGVPLYGTLIGLEVDGEAVLGVVALPAVGELVAAARGLGAHWYVGTGSPRPARVSRVGHLEQGLFLTTSLGSFQRQGRAAAGRAFLERAQVDRTWGDCFGHMMVATGRAEVMVDTFMQVWDNAPLLPILEEAGGTFTTLEGQPTIHGPSGLSTNGHVLDEVLALLGSPPDPRMP